MKRSGSLIFPLLLVSVSMLYARGLFVPTNSDYRTSRDQGRPYYATDPASMTLRKEIIIYAEELLGVRYKYGGVDPDKGMDCSGMTNYVFQNAGISLQRSSGLQATDGKKVDLDKAMPGDLIFFKRSPNGTIFHVALIVEVTEEELYVIHSTSSQGVIRQEILGSNYWAPKISSVRDVISR